MGADADPFGCQVVVVKEEPGANGGVALGERLADDGHGVFEVGEGQVDIGVAKTAAAPHAAAAG